MKLTQRINEFVAQTAVDIGVIVFPVVACSIVVLLVWLNTKPPANPNLLVLLLPIVAVLSVAGYMMYSGP